MTATQYTSDLTPRARLQGGDPQNSLGEVTLGKPGAATSPIPPNDIHPTSSAPSSLQPEQAAQPPALPGLKLQVRWSAQVGEPRPAPPQSKLTLAFADQYRLPTGKDRQAFIWMKGWLLLQLIQSHFNLFYLGMGDRKGKKRKPSNKFAKNICKFPNSKWSG